MLTVKPLSCINTLWLEVYIGYPLEYVRYVIVVTWARGICLICMPKARGLRAYISGKSREHMLQVICITSDCGFWI